jgi:HlyD family secretion protein
MSTTLKRVITVIALFALSVGAWWGYTRFIRQEPLPEGLIQANGRLEGDTVTISSEYPGRIARIAVDEGDEVAAGDILVELVAEEIEARVRQAEQGVVAAVHELGAVRAQAEQARRDAKRFEDLYADGTATKREAEQAVLAKAVAEERQTAAEAQLRRAEEILNEGRAVRDDLVLAAPEKGVITNRVHEPGTVIAAGAPILTLVDLDALYLKVYVPENEIGKLRRGLPARIYADAFPEQPFIATVRYIASRAEFTPKEVQTPDERVKLVYAVKLYLETNPEHRLTPGLPADAVIRWQQDSPWAPPRW